MLLGIKRFIPLQDKEHWHAQVPQPFLRHSTAIKKCKILKRKKQQHCLLYEAGLKTLVYEMVIHTREQKEKRVRKNKMHFKK